MTIEPVFVQARDVDANIAGVITDLGAGGVIAMAGRNKISVQAVPTTQAASGWILTVEGANVNREEAFVSIETLSGAQADSLFTEALANKAAFVRVRKSTAADATLDVAVHGWHE